MSTRGWSVRRVSIDADLGELYAVESEVTASSPHVLDTGGPQAFRQFLAGQGRALAFIWTGAGAEPVGYLALLDDDSGDLEVRSIAVTPRAQGSGLGSEMMATAERVAADLGKRRLVLATSPDNTGAIRFYERHGFTTERVEPDYFGDGTPRRILTKPLPQS